MPILRRRTRRQIRDDYEAAAHAAALSPIAVLVVVLIILVIAGAAALVIWLLTASSGVRGNAAVTRQHNSGQNQILQNTKLLGDYATIQADLDHIKTLMGEQQTQQDRVNLQGLQLNCASDVHAYNADAASILAVGYLPDGQPQTLAAALCTTGATLKPLPTSTTN